MQCYHIPDDIEYIGIYAACKCIQTEFECIISGRFNQKTKDDNPRQIYSSSAHSLSSYTEYDKINIDAYAEIKYIKYKSTINKSDYNILQNIKKVSDIYEWKIEGYALNNLLDKNKLEYDTLSPIYDEQWSTAIIRHDLDGTEDVLNQELHAFVRVLLIPLGISGMEFILKIKHIRTDDEWKVLTVAQQDEGYRVAGIDLSVKGIYLMDDDDDDEVFSLTMMLQIEIKKCFDDNGDVIPDTDWNKYGIVD